MRVKFQVENTTHVYMPELNGNFTLRQILTILLSDLTQKPTFHLSPDPIRNILWLAEKFERTSNSLHEFSYTSRQTYVKELVLRNMPYCRPRYRRYISAPKQVKNRIFWRPTYLYSECKGSPASLDPGVTIYSHSIEQQ